MTDISFPVKAVNHLDYPHASLPSHLHTSHHTRVHDSPTTDGAQEDEQISCVCGYADDDGYTVQCDKCDRWQHQLCYYPAYEEKPLPEDIDHFCIDCSPRFVNIEYARARQGEKREAQFLAATNGTRRSVPKSHKKKVKEHSSIQTNGWPPDKSRHDRNSDSPRDQPPPAKRPKTSHRPSDSTSTTAKVHSRKRNMSSANHRRSMSRTPDTPSEQYSEEFLQSYVEDQWDVASQNCYGISVMDAMQRWLDAPDDEFRQEVNAVKSSIYQRWDAPLETIPGRAEIEVLELPDESAQYDGMPLIWKAVTVREPIAGGAFIGELKGHVGLKSDYQQDPSNRWDQIRHPAPFVFFHPNLPMVIDARQEGTELRYIRRSCAPNARLQVLVTPQNDHHFCFMATEQIEPGVEITIPWDTFNGLPQLTGNKKFNEHDIALLSAWVSNVVANCGPCACQKVEIDCWIRRMDRRGKGFLENMPSSKAAKGRKRKLGQHVSPANTHAVTSPSGSEARHIENHDDEESTHSRSTSGSASRDITPNTHYSTNGASSNMPELSERERKKLAKEEEMFRKQEEQRNGKQAKKKRSSAGSSNNTPGATSSRSSAWPYGVSSKSVDASTTTSKSAQPKTHIRHKSKSSKTAARSAVTDEMKRRRDYTSSDTGVQCDLDQEEANRYAALRPNRKVLPLRDFILKRVAERRAQNSPSPSPVKSASATVYGDNMEIDTGAQAGELPSLSPSAKTSPLHPPQAEVTTDDNVPADQSASLVAPIVTKSEPVDESSLKHSLDFQSPTWSTLKASSPGLATPSTNVGSKHPILHVDMPPPDSNFGQQQHPIPSAGSTTVITPNPLVQTPTSISAGTSLLSPSLTNSVQPQPSPSSSIGGGAPKTTKKLSLSEYRSRKKLNVGDASSANGGAEREGSPASTASGPVTTSLGSSSINASHLHGSAIAEESSEDIKMEDAPPPAAVTESSVNGTATQ